MRARHLSTVLGAGILAGSFACADGLKIERDGAYLDLTRSTRLVDGVARQFELVGYDALTKSFEVTLSPALDLSERVAHRHIVLTVGITCLHLGGTPDTAQSGERDGDAWVFAAECVQSNECVEGCS
ncbi:MAG: hypothetical protein MK160_12050 [Rhodobacteraceae bacterium]|nr:hypothetical protein [Paracoccaceae bacterium]